MTITREEFDKLQVGDYLKTENSTLLVEAKFANSIIAMNDKHHACTLSFTELQEFGYSLIPTIQHNCGFPYGDYSDREVVVKVSNASIVSIKHCGVRTIYTRLISVNETGFQDHNGDNWKYAVLVSNNVDLVK